METNTNLTTALRTWVGLTQEEAEAATARIIQERRNRQAAIEASMVAVRHILDATTDITTRGVESTPTGYAIRVKQATTTDPVFGMRVATPGAKQAVEALRLVLSDTDIDILVGK